MQRLKRPFWFMLIGAYFIGLPAVSIAFFYADSLPRQYESSAVLQVTPMDVAVSKKPISSDEAETLLIQLPSEVSDVVMAAEFQEQLSAILRESGSSVELPAELRNMIKVMPYRESAFVEIKVRTDDPTLSAQIANLASQGFVENWTVRSGEIRWERFRTIFDAIEQNQEAAQATAVKSRSEGSVQKEQERILDLFESLAFETPASVAPAYVVSQAEPAIVPVGPDVSLITWIGGLSGLGIGALLGLGAHVMLPEFRRKPMHRWNEYLPEWESSNSW